MLLMKTARRLALIVVFSLVSSQSAVAQFTQQGPKLVGTADIGQGWSVALSADGNTAIVGGYLGALIWIRSGVVWSGQGGILAGSGAVVSISQGKSVALSADGNTALVGSSSDNGNAGAVWVWTRSGGVWTQQGAKLVGSGAVGNAQQGFSASLSADGNTAIVGGWRDNGNAGAAWIWTRSGGVWTQQGAKLVGSGAVGNAQQGNSVSLAGDGNRAIVGGYLDNGTAGAAWIWTRSGGVWTQQGTKLVGSGAAGNAQQGASVALSADGNTSIVGGYFDNSVTAAGAAWIWIRSGGVWTQQGNKLVPSDAYRAEQGNSVSLSADGNMAATGGFVDNPHPSGSINGPPAVTGAAWVWRRSGGVWNQLGPKLVGSFGDDANQGTSVALSGDGNTLIVGGPSDSFLGAAWVFVPNSIASTVPTLSAFASVILLLSIALLAVFRLR